MNFRESVEEKSRSKAGFSLIEAICMTMALIMFTLLLAGVTRPFWSGKEAAAPTTDRTASAAPPAAAAKK